MNRFARIIGCVAVAFSAPAAAQIAPDVTVNPQAGGSQVLLYPDGQHSRVVRPLLEPGDADPGAPILLHMPRRHPVEHRTVAKKAPAKPKTEVAAVPPTPQPETTAAPPEAGTAFSSLPSESAARLLTDATPPAKPHPASPPKPAPAKPAPVKQASVTVRKPAPKAAPKSAPPPPTVAAQTPPPAPPPPQRVATAEAPPASDSMKEVTGRSSVAFPAGGEEPQPAALDEVRALVGALNASLWSGSARVQLDAFGGGRGDKSSDARRLSLKRALIVRQLLIDDGIPSERIDVHALGGADNGSPDRVDIYVRG
jgi:outer membrane protein OmpA-like peptidoglycan-associated protein